MNELTQLMLAIFCPMVCGLVSLVLPRKAIGLRVAVALAGPIGALALLGHYAYTYGTDHAIDPVAWMPMLQLNLCLNADRLGLFFAFLVSGIGLLITLYARGYFGPNQDDLYRFYPSLHLFMTAMIGVALADNFMLLLLFWEMTSISSFLLIGWERDDPKAVKLAMQAFIVTGLGGLVMMGGLILMGITTGQWTFTGLLAQGVTASPLITTAFVLIFVGAAAKSAQIPFHFWLPGAMAAPTPVSAYLHSATMVKAGVYLTGRLWPILAAALPLWPQLIVPLGAATMVYAAFIAIQKQDLKQIFAYTTVSQLGLLICMYGLAAFEYVHHGGSGGHEASGAGHPNIIWDVTQILNHAMYKAPLFILAGAIGHIASRQLGELRGLFYRGRTARIMTVVLLLAGYALAAGPFTVSFTAKEFFFYQIYHAKEAMPAAGFWALVCAGIATGMFNVAIFIRLCRVLLAKPQAAVEHDHDNHGHAHASGGHGDHAHETGLWPAFLWIPGLIIVSFQYIGGIIPGAWTAMFGWLERPASQTYAFVGDSVTAFPLVWNAHPGFPLYMSLIAITLGLGLGFSRLLSGIYADPFDKVYPGFYTGTTQIVGPRIFGFVQRGHAGFYVGAVSLAIVFLFGWTVGFNPQAHLVWPAGATFETQADNELWPAIMVGILICATALLMPIVTDRAARVLVLGTCGFSVTAWYYLYKAPDLALTQISIEIVSLILFLLVLSLLPSQTPGPARMRLVRGVIALSVGLVMFWLTLTSSVGPRPTMPYLTSEGERVADLGQYFLRNSAHAVDTVHVPVERKYGQVVDRGEAHLTSFGSTDPHATDADGQAPPDTAGQAPAHATVQLHKGGGGNNVVNVILVDFRGFDTMGEITVLGLAAMGVWTLLRKHRNARGEVILNDAEDLDEQDSPPGENHDPRWHVDLGEPTGEPDAEDDALNQANARKVIPS